MSGWGEMIEPMIADLNMQRVKEHKQRPPSPLLQPSTVQTTPDSEPSVFINRSQAFKPSLKLPKNDVSNNSQQIDLPKSRFHNLSNLQIPKSPASNFQSQPQPQQKTPNDSQMQQGGERTPQGSLYRVPQESQLRVPQQQQESSQRSQLREGSYLKNPQQGESRPIQKSPQNSQIIQPKEKTPTGSLLVVQPGDVTH